MGLTVEVRFKGTRKAYFLWSGGESLRAGEAVCLSGPLGAGKSTLARALVRALTTPDEEVPSPTFTLVQFYEGPRLDVAHFDLYRLSDPDEAYEIGLDEALETHNAALPRLKEFILPAGTRSAAIAHVARTIARRAERSVIALAATETLNAAPRQYLNRLSDLLFVLARVLNRANLDGLGGDDVYWQSERMKRLDAAS